MQETLNYLFVPLGRKENALIRYWFDEHILGSYLFHKNGLDHKVHGL